jgi:hypothetical protein
MSFDVHLPPSSPPGNGAPPAGVASRSLVFFDRRELNQLMQLYGRMVSAGEWRDYAIDGLSDCAVFSVYRRASEAPFYRIEKRPELARRQGAWSVANQAGLVLRRGHELSQLLKVFDSRRFRVVD